MKYLHLLLVCSLIVGCSSAPTDGELEPSPFGSNQDLDAPAEPEKPTAGTKPIPPPADKGETPKYETPSNAYGPLSEAYKAQNDEGIHKAATQILNQNPTDPKALNALGLYHYHKGRFMAARYFFGRAAAANPKSGEVQNNMGLVAIALDEPREGIRYFKKALELNPDDGIAAANLGSIYVAEKDYNKASIALEIAVKNGMREAKTLNNYGIALAATGKFDQARKRYDEALKLSSSNQETLFNLAVLLIEKLNAPAEGLDQLNRLRFLGPGSGMRNKMNALENKAKAGIK